LVFLGDEFGCSCMEATQKWQLAVLYVSACSD